jgi:bifunctional DNA-binding transcriptional regulator/antitoxin component of YhaV-PrlF toxin-antitoxin module
MKYFSKIEVNEDGEYYIVIPDDLAKELNWNIGDNIEWVIEGDSVILRKEVSND